MAAVGKTALREILLHIAEGFAQAVGYIPHPQFTHAGSVYNHGAAGQHDELPVSGGVTAFGVILPDAVDSHHILTGQGIYKAGFAHAGGSQENNCLPGSI